MLTATALQSCRSGYTNHNFGEMLMLSIHELSKEMGHRLQHLVMRP